MMKKEKPKTKRIKTRRIRRKITLGKVKNKVGVLVKSKKTRKIIKNEVSVLKKKPIGVNCTLVVFNKGQITVSVHFLFIFMDR